MRRPKRRMIRKTTRRAARRPVRRDWDSVIEGLNRSQRRKLSIRMGSPGSAQVTRCRLLEGWSNLRVSTRGAMLHIQLAD